MDKIFTETFENRVLIIQDSDLSTDFVRIIALDATRNSPYDSIRLDIAVQVENFSGANASIHLGLDALEISIAELEKWLERGFESGDRSILKIESTSPGEFVLAFQRIYWDVLRRPILPPFILIEGSIYRYLYSKPDVNRLNLGFYLTVNENTVQQIIDFFTDFTARATDSHL